MSDFDEEAERKRLREKYERDEERRKEAQQMSELLLKGATMTNRHCGECGSPIFSYQGQEFCPTCQRTAESSQADESAEAADAAGTAADEAADVSAAANQTADTTGAAETPDATGADGTTDATRATGAAEAPTANARSEGDAVDAMASSARSTADPTANADAAAPDSVGRESTPTTSSERDASERDARESLLRALTRHARLAEETADPRRARDHLAAAREAAEALDELD